MSAAPGAPTDCRMPAYCTPTQFRAVISRFGHSRNVMVWRACELVAGRQTRRLYCCNIGCIACGRSGSGGEPGAKERSVKELQRCARPRAPYALLRKLLNAPIPADVLVEASADNSCEQLLASGQSTPGAFSRRGTRPENACLRAIVTVCGGKRAACTVLQQP